VPHLLKGENLEDCATGVDARQRHQSGSTESSTTTGTESRQEESCAMSKMRESMISQPDELARLLADEAPAEAAANRLAGRRVRLIGIGTSWHAAHHGAWMLREAGIEAEACIPPISRPTGERSTPPTA
jgi:DNA-binding MurR/RpiR family transcriptional regulator